MQAAELAPPRLDEIRRMFSVDIALPHIPLPYVQGSDPAPTTALPGVPELSLDLGAATLPVAAAAAALLAAGFAFRRRLA